MKYALWSMRKGMLAGTEPQVAMALTGCGVGRNAHGAMVIFGVTWEIIAETDDLAAFKGLIAPHGIREIALQQANRERDEGQGPYR